MGGMGIQSSRMCTEIISEYFECLRAHGFWGKVGGRCGVLQREMDACLDREVPLHSTGRMLA